MGITPQRSDGGFGTRARLQPTQGRSKCRAHVGITSLHLESAKPAISYHTAIRQGPPCGHFLCGNGLYNGTQAWHCLLTGAQQRLIAAVGCWPGTPHWPSIEARKVFWCAFTRGGYSSYGPRTKNGAANSKNREGGQKNNPFSNGPFLLCLSTGAMGM